MEVWAGLLGVVVGGAIAAVGQVWPARRAELRDEYERRLGWYAFVLDELDVVITALELGGSDERRQERVRGERLALTYGSPYAQDVLGQLLADEARSSCFSPKARILGYRDYQRALLSVLVGESLAGPDRRRTGHRGRSSALRTQAALAIAEKRPSRFAEPHDDASA